MKNLRWCDNPQVTKGDIGEKLVADYLKSQGFNLYKPDGDSAHIFDFIAFKDKDFKFAVEVKTKPAFAKYAQTGFDYRSYETYRAQTKKLNMRVKIFFVDAQEKRIYGGFLDELEKPCDYQGIAYPRICITKTGDKIICFPTKTMEVFAEIDAETVKKLADLDSSKYRRFYE